MSPKAQIISIGDEILYGQTLDTNAHWISGELDALGIRVAKRLTIGDDRESILHSLDLAIGECNVILITGGLGPTKDDLTKPLLAEYFGSEMSLHGPSLENIQQIFDKAGREVTEVNKQQAMLPNKCTPIPNPMGTASGMWFDERDTIIVSMPGVPYEMRAMMTATILPKLAKALGSGSLSHTIVKTIGIPESSLADLIADWESNLPSHLKLAYLPSPGQVKLRLTAIGDPEDLKHEVSEQIAMLEGIIQKYIYGYGQDEIEEVIGRLLKSQGLTLAVAESCTGGMLGQMITSVSGASDYFKGGIIAYDNSVKQRQLSVDLSILEEHGAVSQECVEKMAEGVRKNLGTDIGISISGIAGPNGGTEEKPVGTVWIGYSDASGNASKKFNFTKDRKLNIKLSALSALNMARIMLSKN